MQWQPKIETMQGGSVHRVTISKSQAPVSYVEIIDRWRSDDAFREFFTGLLAAAPYDAFLWETPPITRKTANQPFEFVLIESPALAAMRPDLHSFADYFEAAEETTEVVSFRNLGGDAHLVAPRPVAPSTPFPHLAAFARTAPARQQHAFWNKVGSLVADGLSDRPLWLSTNGLGVAWLHVRMDTRPKYYAFQPYRAMA